MVRTRRNRQGFIEIHLLELAAMYGAGTQARVIHQDSAHHSRRHGEKVCAVLPADLAHIHEAKVSFVDEGGGLQ